MSVVELILGILAGYGVAGGYPIFSNYEFFIVSLKIPLEHFISILALLVEKVALKDPKTDNSVKEIEEDATFVIHLIAATRAMTDLPST